MRVGVYIVTGYLGSGKTTLLQKLLAYLHEQGGNVVVMMNEMGELDIDGEQIQGMGFPVRKLLDGCICCSIRGELTEGLTEVLHTLKPEHIIIETTGVADPIDVVDALTAPELYDQIELKGTVSVVDASRYLELSSRFQTSGALVKTLRNQVKYADLIVLNKTDLVSEAECAKVKKKLQTDNGFAPLYTTVQGEMDFAELLAVKRQAVVAQTDRAHVNTVQIQKNIGRRSPFDLVKQTLGLQTAQPSLYNSIESFAYHFTGPVKGNKFEAFLLGLPKTVYRAKGYVAFASQTGVVSFQHTDNQVILVPYADFATKEVAVFIGEGLDQAKIIADLEKCYA